MAKLDDQHSGNVNPRHDGQAMHEVDMTKCLLISLNEWRDRREDTSAMVETCLLYTSDAADE